MTRGSRFDDLWDPVVLEEEVLASGTWAYQGTVEYAARLVRRKWDYATRDIAEIEASVTGIALDYLDYHVGEDGNVFFWVFEGPTGTTESRTFALYEEASAHLATFEGTVNITWSAK